MNDAHQFTFQAGALAWIVSALTLIVAAAISYFAWRRSGYARGQAMLELMRLSIITLVLLALNEPEWIRTYQPDTRPVLAVWYDDSPSMATRDVSLDGQGRSDLRSRAEVLEELRKQEAWQNVAAKMQVIIQPISSVNRDASGASDPEASPGEDVGTNLHDPLMTAAALDQPLQAVVLMSDGDWNEGSPPVQAASQLKLRDVPVFTVPVGSPERLPDVELVNADVPTFAPAGKSVRIPFAIDSSLKREYLTTVTLSVSNGETVTRSVRVQPMGRTTDAITWTPADVGDYQLTVTVPTHDDETIQENNQQTAPIVIREEKLNVLVVESYPRWEYRYLRNALSRDPGVEVKCLLFHPQLDKVGGGSQDYIKVFPGEFDELSEFDVVFLGDVGVQEDQLTLQDCERLAGLVEQQASGLIFMPGWQGRQLSLLATPLEKLFPAVMDPQQPDGWGSRSAALFDLTQRGRRSLLTRLADNADENVQVWESLPGFYWYAPIVRAKAGTEVLAVHNDASNRFGRIPLLITRTYGAGKVLLMGTDAAWRWRKGVEDKYHYRFWGQVVRWMAYQRNMARGEQMRLFYTPEQPQIGQTMSLTAHVMDDEGEPLQRGQVTARIITPSGQDKTVAFQAGDEQWGVFRGLFSPGEPGMHQMTLFCEQTGETLETQFVVRGGDSELAGKPARPDVLRELAQLTGGISAEPQHLDRILTELGEMQAPPPTTARVQLWSHPLLALILITLLGLFWVLRKSQGMI